MYELATTDDLESEPRAATEAHETWSAAQPEVDSVSRTYLNERDDALVTELIETASKVRDLAPAILPVPIVGLSDVHITTVNRPSFYTDRTDTVVLARSRAVRQQ